MSSGLEEKEREGERDAGTRGRMKWDVEVFPLLREVKGVRKRARMNKELMFRRAQREKEENKDET